jgi:hypothetical protein
LILDSASLMNFKFTCAIVTPASRRAPASASVMNGSDSLWK